MNIKEIIEQNNLKTREDINSFMKDFIGELMQQMLDKEFDNHMDFEKGKRRKETNVRNGKSSIKNIKTNYGELPIEMPRDRTGSFEPIIVPKRKTLLMDTADTILMMYAKGNSVRDIKELVKQIYNVDINENFISETTKMVSDEVKAFKIRSLKEIYPFVYMDCMYVNVKENMVSVKKAVYVALGIDIEGKKEVLDFWIGDSESSSFWYGILEELKIKGVKDIIYLCSDGVTGFKEILEQAYPKTIHQRCIVHIVRNLNKCVSRKQWKELCDDLKTIYKTINIESAKDASTQVLEKWKDNKLLYRKLTNDIPHMLQLYEYPEGIRKIVYTTNPIESMNSSLRKVTNGKGSFVNEQALEKVLYLRIKELSDKWNKNRTNNWQVVLNELCIMYGDRVEKYIKFYKEIEIYIYN